MNSRGNLQTNLEHIEDWISQHKLQLNISNIKILTFDNHEETGQIEHKEHIPPYLFGRSNISEMEARLTVMLNDFSCYI